MRAYCWFTRGAHGGRSQFSRTHLFSGDRSRALCGVALPAGLSWGEGKHIRPRLGLMEVDRDSDGICQHCRELAAKMPP